EPSVFKKMTVRDNLKAILEFLGTESDGINHRVMEILESFKLEHLAGNSADSLSGGERRRLEIARALMTSPHFMLLDEPFSGVDPKSVEELQSVIYQLRTHNLGILITDHSVRETLQVTDRSYLIYEGKVELSGTAHDLVSDPRAREVYLGQRFYMDMTPDERRAQGVSSNETPAVKQKKEPKTK
ncbi:MAG TPA: ATP-binding cassette domain-containing protein, partial [Candidatus Sumerlaeota bacterium]|nr:ATP-binding cassette domain-containing protein [Candidatus Sumerlaeota bacterium]